jgi:glycosyltransferase involved in cell wall biosynthesis
MLTSLAPVARKLAREGNVYFDITDVVSHALKNKSVTGIQRVATSVLENIIRFDEEDRYWGLVRDPFSGEFAAADLSFLRQAYNYSDFAARFDNPGSGDGWGRTRPEKYLPNPLSALLRTMHLKLRRARSKSLRAGLETDTPSPQSSCLLPLNLNKGDTIVTMGVGWSTKYREVHELARRFSCKTVSFVYDLIPVTHPQFAPGRSKRFCAWIDHAAKNSDTICTISGYSKRELLSYLHGKGMHREIHVAALPHEFKNASGNSGTDISEKVRRLAKTRFMLCVGTLDRRKNALGLLRAWYELYKQGVRVPDAVICGAAGRGAGEIEEFLHLTGRDAGKAVTIIHNPSDAELELLYRSCQFTAFPSFVEGWGLPVGESLWFGKPVLCANCASMPEAGGKFAVYFDHSKPGSLRDGLRQMIESPVELPGNIREQLTTWEDTAASICSIVHSGHTALACA